MPGIRVNITPTPVPPQVLPGYVSQRLLPIDMATPALSTTARLYPFTWGPDALYRVTAYVRSNVRDGSGMLGDDLADEGTDPVDKIQIQMESPNKELV